MFEKITTTLAHNIRVRTNRMIRRMAAKRGFHLVRNDGLNRAIERTEALHRSVSKSGHVRNLMQLNKERYEVGDRLISETEELPRLLLRDALVNDEDPEVTTRPWR